MDPPRTRPVAQLRDTLAAPRLGTPLVVLPTASTLRHRVLTRHPVTPHRALTLRRRPPIQALILRQVVLLAQARILGPRPRPIMEEKRKEVVRQPSELHRIPPDLLKSQALVTLTSTTKPARTTSLTRQSSRKPMSSSTVKTYGWTETLSSFQRYRARTPSRLFSGRRLSMSLLGSQVSLNCLLRTRLVMARIRHDLGWRSSPSRSPSAVVRVWPSLSNQTHQAP